MTRPPARRPRRAPARALALAGTAAAALALPALAISQEAAPPAPAPAAPAPAAEAPPLMTLSSGDEGPAVRELQRALAGRGHAIAADGEFGPRTATAVRAEQRKLGQEPTGRADPAFLEAIGLELREPPPPPSCAPAEGATPVAAAPAGRWLRVFPVVGEYTYDSGFGAPRHQGAHEGVDIIATRGTPVVAVNAAAVLRLSATERGLGGISIWLRDDSGTEYYYAHLDTLEKLAEGDRVAAGQRIGTVGNTGDARYGAHHLHFEVHPGGGRAVDPYADLRAVDPGSGSRTVAATGCAATAPPAGAAPQQDPDRVTLSVRQLQINQRIAQAAVRRVNRLDARLTGETRDAAPGKGEPGRISLSRAQLLINQRIAQAALVRGRGIEARLEGRPAAARRDGDRAGDRVTLTRGQLLINQRVSQAAVRTANDLKKRVAHATNATG